MNSFKNIVKDIRTRQNLDIYITTILAIIIAILGIFGVANLAVISSVILATLSLVSISLLTNRHENEKTQDLLLKIENDRKTALTSSVFSEWNENAFLTALLSAHEVSGIYVTNYDLLNAHTDEFVSFIKRGGKLRIIFVKPNSAAFKMASQRGFGAAAHLDHLRGRLNLSLDKLKEIADSAPIFSQNIEVKFVDFLPGMAMTMVDHQKTNGALFITVTGFGVNTKSRPSFVLKKENDNKWFEYFQATFENMWNWDKCEIVELKSHNNSRKKGSDR